MAATNVKDRFENPFIGKRHFTRNLQGSGTPVGDTRLADDTKYPIGSTYLDITAGKLYVKKDDSSWADVSA